VAVFVAGRFSRAKLDERRSDVGGNSGSAEEIGLVEGHVHAVEHDEQHDDDGCRFERVHIRPP
jgi:hypothetical protein